MSRPLVLGTRGSALALAQVALVEKAFRDAGVEIQTEVKKITTSGDKRSDFTKEIESGAGVKGLFTKEIEMALLDGSIDVAVHSCKDLPGHLAEDLEIAATLKRADPLDVFVGRVNFRDLPHGAAIGTSSVRRRRQLLWERPDLVVEEMRGNVPTRIEKLRASKTLSGIVLAKAGLNRLGLDLSEWKVDGTKMLPALGQGAVALQCRSNDATAKSLLARINDPCTFTCIRAERELLRLLNGDCNLPVAGIATVKKEELFLQAIIFGAEGDEPLTGAASGPADEPEKVAATLFKNIYP